MKVRSFVCWLHSDKIVMNKLSFITIL